MAKNPTTTTAKAPRKPAKAADPVARATAIHNMLLTQVPKLDKVGGRLERALKMVMDGGDSTNLDALNTQVTDYITNGVPAVMKSTSRGGGAVLNTEDKKQVADEAEFRQPGGPKITTSKNTSDGNYLAVGKAGGDSFVIPHKLMNPEFNAAAAVGQPYAYAKKLADKLIAEHQAKPAHLARGIDGHNSPQSVASHQAKQAAARKGAKPAETAKPAKKGPDVAKEARKAERAEKAAPKGDDKRAITVLKKDFDFGREGSARRASWDKALKAKTVEAYIAAGGAAKYLPRWASAGAIKLG